MAEARFVSRITFLTGGLLVWAVHFTLVYGLNTLACTRLDGTSVLGVRVVPVAIGIATVVAAGLNLLLLASALRGRGPGIADEHDASVRHFWRFGTGMIAALGLVAVVWGGLPALIVNPCY